LRQAGFSEDADGKKKWMFRTAKRFDEAGAIAVALASKYAAGRTLRRLYR
jgi:hypothetical protein